MDWINGIQRAIDYIEEHLSEEIDYDAVAGQSFSSTYHFQRVFGILCGYTLGEYIRSRRLTLAGAELQSGSARVIDVALKYGYESPDSFAKAFVKFHGVTPREAKLGGVTLRSFSRLSLKITFDGGSIMNYKIEKKPAMILTGFRTRFTGTPYGRERERQEEQLMITTRGKQFFLMGAASAENKDAHCVIRNVTDEGYDYSYCHVLDEWEREHLYDRDVMGVDFVESLELENIELPEMTYAVFETSDVRDPIGGYFDLLNLRIKVMTEWMPEMGFRLAENAPELAVYHWNPRSERKVEVWLPVERV